MSDIRTKRSGEWSLENPVLRKGEPGFDSTKGRLKIGDGKKPWNDLQYLPGSYDPAYIAANLPSRLSETALKAAFGSVVKGPELPPVPPGEYVWFRTDGNGNLLDILSGASS